MGIVKYKNQSGQLYAYEQTIYWDEEAQTKRTKKKYLGRVDPDTGEIISTAGRRGRPPKKENAEKFIIDAGSSYEELYKQSQLELRYVQKELENIQLQCLQLENENNHLKKLISSIHQQTSI